MQRRTFVATVGASAASLLASRTLFADDTAPISASPAAKLDRIGLELYAVRKAMKADPERTLASIAAMGYNDVELLWSFNNFDRTVKQTRDALKAAGLKAPSAHMAAETILTEWDERLGEAKELGHQYLVAPSLPREANASIDVVKLWANRFNSAGEVARRYGIWLTLHNEPNHEKPIRGEMPLEVFLRETDPKLVRFQLDVGNMLLGGGDPMAFLARHANRCWSFHLKNVTADRKTDTELGQGTFDLREFLAQVKDLNKKPCFVEQEGGADEMASAKVNYEYVRGLTW